MKSKRIQGLKKRVEQFLVKLFRGKRKRENPRFKKKSPTVFGQNFLEEKEIEENQSFKKRVEQFKSQLFSGKKNPRESKVSKKESNSFGLNFFDEKRIEGNPTTSKFW